MQIVINIDNEMYKDLKDGYTCPEYADKIIKLIPDAVVIPEVCGRLGDLDELEQRISNFIEYNAPYEDEHTLITERFILDGIKDTHTIIEANKESEE